MELWFVIVTGSLPINLIISAGNFVVLPFDAEDLVLK